MKLIKRLIKSKLWVVWIAYGAFLFFVSLQTHENAPELPETVRTSLYTPRVEKPLTSEISGQIENESPQSAADVVSALDAFYAAENGIPLMDNSAYYPITGAERYEIERIVASEGGYCPYEFQALVSECILNGCIAENMRPLELFERGDFWIVNNVAPDEVTKQAVSDVFDKGIMPCEEKIRWYYNPNYCKSEVHESMCYVLTNCDCRFFKDWKD